MCYSSQFIQYIVDNSDKKLLNSVVCADRPANSQPTFHVKEYTAGPDLPVYRTAVSKLWYPERWRCNQLPGRRMLPLPSTRPALPSRRRQGAQQLHLREPCVGGWHVTDIDNRARSQRPHSASLRHYSPSCSSIPFLSTWAMSGSLCACDAGQRAVGELRKFALGFGA